MAQESGSPDGLTTQSLPTPICLHNLYVKVALGACWDQRNILEYWILILLLVCQREHPPGRSEPVAMRASQRGSINLMITVGDV
jgi:hypothetical protein